MKIRFFDRDLHGRNGLNFSALGRHYNQSYRIKSLIAYAPLLHARNTRKTVFAITAISALIAMR